MADREWPIGRVVRPLSLGSHGHPQRRDNRRGVRIHYLPKYRRAEADSAEAVDL